MSLYDRPLTLLRVCRGCLFGPCCSGGHALRKAVVCAGASDERAEPPLSDSTTYAPTWLMWKYVAALCREYHIQQGPYTVIAHFYTSRIYITHNITERNSIALAWDSPHLQRSWSDRPHLVHVQRIGCFDPITDAGIQCIGGVFATSTIDSRMGIHRCETDNKYIPKHEYIRLRVEKN